MRRPALSSLPVVVPVLALAALALAACDSAEPDDEEGATRSYALVYAVAGTYSSCTVRYEVETGGAQTVEVAPDASGRIAWRHAMRVGARAVGQGFLASVAATCADSLRTGKVTASIVVDGVLVATQTTASYGATARAVADLRPVGGAQ